MATTNDEIAVELAVMGIRLYKSGKVERERGTSIVPPSLDPATGVNSRDVVINAATNLSARIYLPKDAVNKLPLLVYFHGGALCIESAFSPTYHPICNALASSANVVIVSVNYRLAPENPIPIPYEDSWEAIKWVISKNDMWLSEHADSSQIFYGGDSAGANIAHQMGIRIGSEGVPGSSPVGMVNDEELRNFIRGMWQFVCPDDSGLGCLDNPFINPNLDQKFFSLGCKRVLVCVAEKDVFKLRGWDYYEKLRASEWKGEVEIFETKGENHVFHVNDVNSETAKDLVKRVGSFLNFGKM